jgi:EAL domain-containing protein
VTSSSDCSIQCALGTPNKGLSMQPSPIRSVRLLKYQSKPSLGAGVEVFFDADEDTRLLLDDLCWLVDVVGADTPTDFFVLTLSNGYSTPRLLSLARDAAARGLSGRLCLTVASPGDEVLAELQRLGIRAVLGGVGVDATFSDLTNPLIDGIVVDGALVSSASGDPQAASVLEAIAGLAKNLGLRTFASRCAQQAELDVAMSCGVDFLTLELGPVRDMSKSQPVGAGHWHADSRPMTNR